MTSPKPIATGTAHTLPFERLSPLDFERLCLALLPHEGFENPEHYGASGSEQGRDIVAHRDGGLWYIQCKRVEECGPKVLTDEIDKIADLAQSDPKLHPTGILFIVACNVSAKARDEARERCGNIGMACEVWAHTDLDARVRQHPDIVTTFFEPSPASTTPTLSPEERQQMERRYLELLAQECSTLRTEGIAEGEVPLMGVFVMLEALRSERKTPVDQRPDLAPEPERMEHASIVERLLGKQPKPSPEPQPPSEPPPVPVPLSKALKEQQHLVLLGEPGAGKSTTLQYIALCFAHAGEGWVKDHLDLDEDRIPVRVELREITARLEMALASVVAGITRVDDDQAQQMVDGWLESGRLIVLLDGLDEVPSDGRDRVIEEIRRFARSPEGRRCRVVLSSRIAGYGDLGSPFGEYRLRPFGGPDEILPYVTGWLAALRGQTQEQVSQEAEELVKQLTGSGSLRRITDNPLLLRLAVSVYVQTGELARSRATLYEQYVEKVLWSRTENRTASRVALPLARRALAAIAWALFIESKRTARDLSNLLEDELPVEDGQELMDFFRQAMGILVLYREEPYVGFAHRPFHEYFIAVYLANGWRRDSEKTWNVLRPRLHHPDWHEPLLLMAERLEDATSLIERIQRARSPYERVLHRDLHLATNMLGEGAQASPAQIGKILKRLLWLVFPLRVDLRHSLILISLVVLCMGGAYLIISTGCQLLSLIDLSPWKCVVELLLIYSSWFLIWVTSFYIHLWVTAVTEDSPLATLTLIGKAVKRLLELLPPLGANPELPIYGILHFGWGAFAMLVWSQFLGILSPDWGSLDLVRFLVWPFGLLWVGLLVFWTTSWSFGLERTARLASLAWWPTRLLGIDTERPKLIKCLAALGDEAVEHVIGQLKSGDRRNRAYAARILGKLGDSRAVDSLITALKDTDAKVRLAAAEALDELGDICPVEPLIVALKDANEDVRKVAAAALGDIGDRQATEPLLETRVGDSSVLVRRNAEWALGQLGSTQVITTPVESLIATLKKRDKKARLFAASALGLTGDHQAIEPLVEVLLSDGDIEVRIAAGLALKQMQAYSLRATELFTEALNSSDSDKEKLAIAAVGLGLVGGQQAPERLVQILFSDIDREIRTITLFMLLQIGDPLAANAAIAVLRRRDDDKLVRQLAAYTLGELGDTQAVSSLETALKDSNEEIRRVAAEALGKLGDVRAVGALIVALRDNDEEVRHNAAWALGMLGDTQAVEPLVEALADKKNHVRVNAAWALGQIGDVRATSPLVQALTHKSSNIRENSAQALGNLAKAIESRHVLKRVARALWWRLTDFKFSLTSLGSEQFEQDVAKAAYAALEQIIARLTELEVAALPASGPLEASR